MRGEEPSGPEGIIQNPELLCLPLEGGREAPGTGVGSATPWENSHLGTMRLLSTGSVLGTGPEWSLL